MSHEPPGHIPQTAGPSVMKVSELNVRLKSLLANLGRIAVQGEVVGLKRAASGHMYFSLKDRLRGVESVLSCAIWRSQVARAQKAPLREGDSIIAHGTLDLYGPRGSYSLIIDRVEPVGLGSLLVQLEQLKRELADLGWFNRKRELPSMPNCVGVVTSRDTAAFQDFLRTRSLRWPGYPVRLAHTKVQGPGAALEIADAIGRLDKSGVDLIVVTRGGGSLEDLWAFNERPVAEAIWRASVPVVSGVGHETDVTLADFVADYRAHTPTDAGQLVIPERVRLEERLDRSWNYLLQAMEGLLEERETQLEHLASARVLRGADWILTSRVEELHDLGRRLVQACGRSLEQRQVALAFAQRVLTTQAPARRFEKCQAQLSSLALRLAVPVKETMARAEKRLELATGRLEAFSPFAVLGRGYSITRIHGQAAPLTNTDELAPGVLLETRLAGASFTSTVADVQGADGP